MKPYFICLHTLNGEEIMVNTSQIVSITNDPMTSGSKIYFEAPENGAELRVQESFQDLIRFLD